MADKTVKIECAECGAVYTIKSAAPEDAQFCPFCGTETTVPLDDVDGDEEDEDDEEDDDE